MMHEIVVHQSIGYKFVGDAPYNLSDCGSGQPDGRASDDEHRPVVVMNNLYF